MDKKLKLLEFELKHLPNWKKCKVNRDLIKMIKNLITKSTNGTADVKICFKRHSITKKCYCRISEIKMTLIEEME